MSFITGVVLLTEILHHINKLPYSVYHIINNIKDTKCASIYPKNKYNQSYYCSYIRYDINF